MFSHITYRLNFSCKIRRFNGPDILVSYSFSQYKDTSQILKIVSKMAKLKKQDKAVPVKLQLLKEDQKYAPGKVFMQVLGSGAVGAPKSLYLFSDQSRYLFNCGEGSQRLAQEHKIKLSKLEHLFVTTSTWDSIGGLPGMSLTLQDSGVTHIHLHGPPGLNEIYEATKRFVVMKNLKVKMANCQTSLPYEDSVMSVSYVPLMKEGVGTYNSFLEAEFNERIAKEKISRRSDTTMAVDYDNTDYYAYEHSDRSKSPNIENSDNEADTAIFRKPKREQVCSMAYICKLKPRLGTLDLQKCVNFGVKPGPMLGLLKSGKNVVLEDATLVRAEDVRMPDEPGAIFIVLDVPDTTYLHSLLSEDLFYEFRKSHTPVQNNNKLPAVIVHFSPEHVIKDERYQTFLKDFTPYTKHMFVNDSNVCLGSVAVHRIQQKLHILNEDIFPMMRQCSIPLAKSKDHLPAGKKDLSEISHEVREPNEFCNQLASAHFQRILTMDDTENDVSESSIGNQNYIQGQTLATYNLRPMIGYDNSSELKLELDVYIAEVMRIEGFAETLQDFKKHSQKLTEKGDTYPKIVFLGTGSSIPSKTRNTSAILVEVSENSVILLDCGEGTFGQIVRLYGLSLANKMLCKLKAIYVSHLHADHHLGLIGVLNGRRKALSTTKLDKLSNSKLDTSRKVYLLAPSQILPWLNFYNRRFENIHDDYEIVSNTAMLYTDSEQHFLAPYILKQLELTNLQTCYVRHCPNAFGISFTIGDKKITYSGDTVPCEELVKLGIDSMLLIHEATMEDELSTEARAKMHSTTSQAIEIGNKMNAKFVVLTHFSQRYARMPRLKDLKSGIKMHNVGIAFDNMQISLNQLPILPHMYKPLELIFAEHCQEMDIRAEKRAFKRIRNRSLGGSTNKTTVHTHKSAAKPADPVLGKGDDLVISAKKQKDAS